MVVMEWGIVLLKDQLKSLVANQTTMEDIDWDQGFMLNQCICYDALTDVETSDWSIGLMQAHALWTRLDLMILTGYKTRGLDGYSISSFDGYKLRVLIILLRTAIYMKEPSNIPKLINLREHRVQGKQDQFGTTSKEAIHKRFKDYAIIDSGCSGSGRSQIREPLRHHALDFVKARYVEELKTPQQNGVAEERIGLLLKLLELYHLGKFDGKSEEENLLGYSTNSKGFRVYNRVTRKVQDCLHVNFLENQATPNKGKAQPMHPTDKSLAKAHNDDKGLLVKRDRGEYLLQGKVLLTVFHSKDAKYTSSKYVFNLQDSDDDTSKMVFLYKTLLIRSVDYDEGLHHLLELSKSDSFSFAFHGLYCLQMDVKRAFFIGNITEEVYVNKPQVLKYPAHPNRSTPIEAHKSLGKDEEGEAGDVHLYRSILGVLKYLTAFKGPDLGFLFVLCAKFQVTPRISFHLEASSDSELCQGQHDRRSTSGGCSLDAKSNYCYGFNFMITKINLTMSATIAVKNPVFHSKTKHIQIRHHFIRDCYEQRLINVVKVHTDDNVADLLTKGFDLARFNFLVVTIGMMNP
ncbi:hypothetical protein Tco_0286303 [Tanacetum coccineum]